MVQQEAGSWGVARWCMQWSSLPYLAPLSLVRTSLVGGFVSSSAAVCDLQDTKQSKFNFLFC